MALLGRAPNPSLQPINAGRRNSKSTNEDFIERFWSGVTPHTKVIYLSHTTSPTALTFPLEELCCRAREAGILTVIDGAHMLGQRDLFLDQIGCDFYAGNSHKWH